MTGKIVKAAFGFAFIQPDTNRGPNIFCHASEMPCDDIGRRYLLPDEMVTFDIGDHQGRTVAKNVELVHPRPVADLKGYFEEGCVHKVGRQRAPEGDAEEDSVFQRPIIGEWCFVHRPFGGVGYLHWQNVKSSQSSCNNRISFFVGQLWRYEIKPPRNGNDNDAWQCINAVELFEDDDRITRAGDCANRGLVESVASG